MPMTDAAACLVGRLDEDGPWLGFAPSLDDGYDLVATDGERTARLPAAPDDLLSLAIAYFEETAVDAPEQLAATHADIAALVRHVAERAARDRRAALQEAIDAIDDGLDGNAVVSALRRCLDDETDPVERLAARGAAALAGISAGP